MLPKVEPDKCVLGPDTWDQVTVGWLANAGITLEKQASHGSSDEHLTVQILSEYVLKGLMTADELIMTEISPG